MFTKFKLKYCIFSRPETSFSFFKSPLKMLRYLVCRLYKWKIIKFVFFLLLIFFIGVGLYAFPGYSVKRFLGAWIIYLDQYIFIYLLYLTALNICFMFFIYLFWNRIFSILLCFFSQKSLLCCNGFHQPWFNVQFLLRFMII